VSADGREIEVKGAAGKSRSVGLRLNTKEEVAFLNRGGFIYCITDVLVDPGVTVLTRNHLKVRVDLWATLRLRPDAPRSEAV
jgi:hypothetical protein